MRKILNIVIILFLFSEILNAQDRTAYKSAIESISINSYQEKVSILGSDIFQGRGPGELGASLSAKYLAREMRLAGLKPAGTGGTYYQYVPMHSSLPLKESELKVYCGDKEFLLELNEDYLLFKTGEQTYLPKPAGIVFAGYGIVAPEFDYNDYQDIDVEGKIVMVMYGEPLSGDENYFDGPKLSIYNNPESKLRIALARGARGVIFIPPLPYNGGQDWYKIKKMYAFKDIHLAYSVSSSLGVIINPEAADVFFNNCGHSLEEIYNMHAENKMKSFEINSKISFKGKFKENDFVEANIIGIIEGNDPELKDSYVLLSAHYDHLGIGPAVKGDSIYNGVMDNAMGVAAVLEIAKAFNKLENEPQRSVIFLLTTGEESGLLGARYYVDHPVFPLNKTVANLNVDGIALLINSIALLESVMNYPI